MYNVILLCTMEVRPQPKLVNSVYSSMDGQDLSWLCDMKLFVSMEKKSTAHEKYGRSYSGLK